MDFTLFKAKFKVKVKANVNTSDTEVPIRFKINFRATSRRFYFAGCHHYARFSTAQLSVTYD